MNDQASTQQQYATVPQDVIDSNALQSVDEEYGVPTTWGQYVLALDWSRMQFIIFMS